MAVYSASIEFVLNAKNDRAAEKLAEKIGEYIKQEELADAYSLIDLELLEPDEEPEQDEDEDTE